MSRDKGPTRIPTVSRWYHRAPNFDAITVLQWIVLTLFFASLAVSAGIFWSTL